jgi:HEPN domain-containing protein
MKKEEQEYINSWIQKAEQDLKLVNIVFESEDTHIPFNLVCYHCQQCVEKYLKAYLIFLNISFPKSHSIAHLIGIASKIDEEIGKLNNAEKLTGYAIETRYPDDFYMPSTEEVAEAVEIVNMVKKYVLLKIKNT